MPMCYTTVRLRVSVPAPEGEGHHTHGTYVFGLHIAPTDSRDCILRGTRGVGVFACK